MAPDDNINNVVVSSYSFPGKNLVPNHQQLIISTHTHHICKSVRDVAPGYIAESRILTYLQ
jgi:hypothetical protein